MPAIYPDPNTEPVIFNQINYPTDYTIQEEVINELNNLNINQASNNELHTGVIDGGVISINALDDTKIDITAGSAMIVDYTTDPSNITATTFSWSAQTAITPTGNNVFSLWIGVYLVAGVATFFYTTSPTPLDRREKAFVGRIWSTVGNLATKITNQARYLQPAYALTQAFQDFTLGISSMNLEGNVFSAGTLLKVSKSPGKSYRYWTDPANVGYECTHIDGSLTDVATYNYHLQGSDVTTTKTTMDFENYDNAGVSSAVTAGYWTVQEIWYYPVSQVLAVLYGQKQYPNLPAAFTGLSSEIKIRNTNLLTGAIFRSYVIGQKGISTLADGFFIEQSTLNTPMMSSGNPYQSMIKSYTMSDVGTDDTSYIGGFYEAPAAHTTLTIGGTVTQTYGTANLCYAAYAFVVASAASANACVLTVSGKSIDDNGVTVVGDSEVVVANTSTSSTNAFYQTVKKWLGTITYTLTGAAGAFTFNYGLAQYEHMGDRDFIITSFTCYGKSAANGTNYDIQLLHHEFTGWTYSAAAFVPGSTPVCSMLTDYGASSSIATGEYYSYTRTNLYEKVKGTIDEGMLVRVHETTNNAFRYGSFAMNIIII